MMTISGTIPPEIELSFGGTALSHLQWTWIETSYSMNRIPTAKITLAAPGASVWNFKKYAEEAAKCTPGTKAEIKIKSGPVLFSGIILQQECTVDPQGGKVIILKLKHPLHGLTTVHRSQVFQESSDADTLRGIFGAQKVKLGKLEGLKVKHAQLIQFNCTDWQFVKSRLNANGVWLVPGTEQIDIIEPKLTGKADHTLLQSDTSTSNGLDKKIQEARWQFSCETQKIEIAAWDVPGQKMSSKTTANAPSLGNKGLDPKQLKPFVDTPSTLAYSLPLVAEEQSELGKGRLLAKHAAGIQASFTLFGSTAYTIGQILELSGFEGPFDGSGLITEVKHVLFKGSWSTTLVVGQDSMCNLDAGLLPRVPGVHIGIVDAYEKDKDNWNRIKVKIPTLMVDKPLWARFAAPYATAKSGLCMYPEKGDEVVLSFFDEDPRYPVILGSMHNPKNPPPYPPSAENAQMGLVFDKDGVEQRLLFDKKEASATLEVKKGSDEDQLVLKQGVQINSKKNIEAQAQKDITLKATTKLQAEGTSGVKIKGAKIDMNS